ncbi:MAG: zinc-ribbon domain-containing protein, partial [Deltaproteobacteria bacterium]|nr:zinc-ribbon domain-containing protein [Deltaproteobacteria bacterium]
MKFFCDKCNTKYSIADDKVRGKILKIRCKKCGNVIVVRELVPTPEVARASRSPAPAPAPAPAPRSPAPAPAPRSPAP